MASKRNAPFDIRMLWASTPEQREKARAIGCNWGVVYTCGHRRNDFPIFYKADARIAALRKMQSAAVVREERTLLRQGVDHAHRLGLKALIHSYEVSIPEEFRAVYPELYQPEIHEYRDACPAVRHKRAPCPSDPRVREIISRKVAETLAAADGVDGYAFCLNECLSGTRINHRCERCRDIPFPQMIKWVADAVRDGVRSAGGQVQFFHRMWGLNENDDGWKNFGRRFTFSEGCGEPWLEAHAKAFAPEHLHYVPSRDLPVYVGMQRNEEMGFITKGTWADISIDHPLNPYIGLHAKHHPTIVELSWENTNHHPAAFHVLACQFQRMARYARDRGASGLAGIPCAWGYKSNHHGVGGHDGGGRPRIGNLDESYHRLAMLNFDVFQTVVRDPDADLERVLDAALKRRYGVRLPARMAQLMIESQTIRAGINNYRGIQCTGENLERMYYQILRYGPTVPNWEKRLSRDPANIRRLSREKEANMRRAGQILDEIEALSPQMPEAATAEFKGCFADLRDEAVLISRRQILHFLLWTLKDGTMRPGMATIQLIEKQIRSENPSIIA
jgi:hypothetical protein